LRIEVPHLAADPDGQVGELLTGEHVDRAASVAHRLPEGVRSVPAGRDRAHPRHDGGAATARTGSGHTGSDLRGPLLRGSVLRRLPFTRRAHSRSASPASTSAAVASRRIFPPTVRGNADTVYHLRGTNCGARCADACARSDSLVAAESSVSSTTRATTRPSASSGSATAQTAPRPGTLSKARSTSVSATL